MVKPVTVSLFFIISKLFPQSYLHPHSLLPYLQRVIDSECSKGISLREHTDHSGRKGNMTFNFVFLGYFVSFDIVRGCGRFVVMVSQFFHIFLLFGHVL